MNDLSSYRSPVPIYVGLVGDVGIGSINRTNHNVHELKL